MPYEAYIISQLPEDVKRILDPQGQRSELHLTLFCVGWIDPAQLPTLRRICTSLAMRLNPLKAQTAGPGIFTNNPSGRPSVMLVDAIGLDIWRYEIMVALHEAGLLQKQHHGFIPHITLDYVQEEAEYSLRDYVDPRPKWTMDSLTLSYEDVDGGFDDFRTERFALLKA